MLWQQGVKLGRAQSQQPLDTATLQDTLRELTETHNDMERWVLWDIHRDIQIHKHAAVPRNTRMPDTAGHM